MSEAEPSTTNAHGGAGDARHEHLSADVVVADARAWLTSLAAPSADSITTPILSAIEPLVELMERCDTITELLDFDRAEVTEIRDAHRTLAVIHEVADMIAAALAERVNTDTRRANVAVAARAAVHAFTGADGLATRLYPWDAPTRHGG